LVLYVGGLFVTGLATAMALDAHQPAGSVGPALELIFGPGHNAIRLSLVALMALVLAISVARGRQTLLAALVAARRSAHLSRYFASGLVPLLADAELKRARHQHAAILFADIRGFTSLSEHSDPAAIAEFLSSFRTRASRAIEAHVASSTSLSAMMSWACSASRPRRPKMLPTRWRRAERCRPK
jgi:hypothetical protein